MNAAAAHPPEGVGGPLDQLPLGALGSVACILAAAGARPAHALCLDTGLRPVVASVGGWTVPTTIYATPRLPVRPSG